ncbi:MAG: sigma-70 family RNA polymerase sigma factor [Armatimonadetes bacterium]|nr:sigma-70 family RNA polymerase sigma factor [Armatimonadota bacterium]
MNPKNAWIDLVESARKGDRQAFDRLADLYKDMVFAVCLKWAGNAADAEDLTQDALIRAYTRLDQLEDPARFPAWLCRIAVNRCKTWLAREKRRDMSLLEAENIPGAARPDDDALAVREAMASLPEDLRRALRLFYLDGMTQREMACLWRVPESTVKGRLDAGRRRLRKEMLKMGLMPDVAQETGVVLLPNARIAVADPDRKAARALCDIFKKEGYPCTAITRGDLLIARLRQVMPGILILTAPFEDIDEFEILRAMKIAPRLREIATVLLVPKEKATQEHVFAGWQAGVECYLTRPYILAELVDFVRRIDQKTKSELYRALAIEHAWHRDTPKVLDYLRQAAATGGETAVAAIREEPAFNYIRHLEAFQEIAGG